MKSGNIVAVLALFTTATGQGLTQTTHTASEPPPAVTLDVRPPPSPERAAIRIGSDGQSITVEGSLGPGTAARFAIVVESAPNVKTIVLHSAGGMVAEADEMAAVVRDRRLDTYVETICLSACTMILLAGTDRAVAPVARIGFHRPYMPGRTGLMSAESLRAARAYYDNAGVKPDFTDRVFATPSNDMWYPSYEQMLAARFVTRQTLGGETTAIFSQIADREQLESAMLSIPMWRDLKQNYPDISRDVIEAAWSAKRRGDNDGEIMTAARSVLAGSIHKIFQNVSDDLIGRYVGLMAEEAKAARSISFEACALFAKGQLNIAATLPRTFVDRELAILSEAVAGKTPRSPPDESAALALMEPIFLTMTDDQISAVAFPEKDHSDAARCEGSIALFNGMNALPRSERSIVGRFMLQSAP